jgi:adenylate kinase
MRALVTGQVGMDKKSYLDAVAQEAIQRGQSLQLYNVGDMMYAEAADVAAGRILDLPLSRLQAVRRGVFRDIINQSQGQANLIVNTHATFRWRHGLFAAFDFDQMSQLGVNVLICLMDNVEVVHHRLHSDHISDATLKDLMVWREEEIMATELLAQALGCQKNFYILSRGRHSDTSRLCHRLICQPDTRKVYPSFPMTHVANMPELQSRIDKFRAELAEHFIAFDPGDVDEKLLLEKAIDAAKQGKDFIEVRIGNDGDTQLIRVSVKQVLDIAGDIDGQIYARDFKLIDQSDMIVSLIPQLPGGMPGLSSGVERELQHAFEHGKEVYVIWEPQQSSPSPFITETATEVFDSTAAAMSYFHKQGMFVAKNLFGQ